MRTLYRANPGLAMAWLAPCQPRHEETVVDRGVVKEDRAHPAKPGADA
jgi:hypothetical protein